jgi:DNA-binding CsgD family transcriptional regulator
VYCPPNGGIPFLPEQTNGMNLLQSLTSRELEIVRLIVSGLTDQKIAARLHISRHTASTHRKKILTKINVPNTASLVRLAVQNGLDR